MSGATPAQRTFSSDRVKRDPKVEAARKARLERERNADALAAIESLQRQMREKVRQQDAWRLPDPPEAA